MSTDYRWPDFIRDCETCNACNLSQARQNVVIFRGALDAPLMFVGEGPGAREDEQGLPFVGQAGQLLDLLLQAYGFEEKHFHICNIVKCRPPGNRVPTYDEAKSCLPLLGKQIRFVRPKIIVLLGATAYRYFTQDPTPIGKVRGQWIQKSKFLIYPTFHPAYILRNNNHRITLWRDIGEVRKKLEELDLIAPLAISPPDMPTGRS